VKKHVVPFTQEEQSQEGAGPEGGRVRRGQLSTCSAPKKHRLAGVSEKSPHPEFPPGFLFRKKGILI
jgi:hypothetical protein